MKQGVSAGYVGKGGERREERRERAGSERLDYRCGRAKRGVPAKDLGPSVCLSLRNFLEK